MDDEGNTKHALLFVVWHLHALHKLGHRPASDRHRTIREVFGIKSGLCCHYLEFHVDAGQQSIPRGDNKDEQDRSLTKQRCVCRSTGAGAS